MSLVTSLDLFNGNGKQNSKKPKSNSDGRKTCIKLNFGTPSDCKNSEDGNIVKVTPVSKLQQIEKNVKKVNLFPECSKPEVQFVADDDE
jgi:hypothetical protein